MGEESNSHRTIDAIFIFKYLRTGVWGTERFCSRNESKLTSCLHGAVTDQFDAGCPLGQRLVTCMQVFNYNNPIPLDFKAPI